MQLVNCIMLQYCGSFLGNRSAWHVYMVDINIDKHVFENPDSLTAYFHCDSCMTGVRSYHIMLHKKQDAFLRCSIGMLRLVPVKIYPSVCLSKYFPLPFSGIVAACSRGKELLHLHRGSGWFFGPSRRLPADGCWWSSGCGIGFGSGMSTHWPWYWLIACIVKLAQAGWYRRATKREVSIKVVYKC